MIGAIIAAAATVGGALLSSTSQKKGARQAADAQVQVAERNNALAREFRASNEANFAPNMASGTRANALLDTFLHGPQAAPQAAVQPTQPVPANNPSMGQINVLPSGDSYRGMTAFSPRGVRNLQVAQSPVTAAPPAAVPSQSSPNTNALSGYEQFVQSPYYQFPLQEGMRQLNHGLAARGRLESGDAIKRAIRYGQDYGYGRMGEYIGLAERQANRGITGASAIAGVGQNALLAQTQNNQNAADALSNAALLRAQANQQLYGSFGNALGYFASSYGKGL